MEYPIDGKMYLDIMEERKKYTTRTARKALVDSYYADEIRALQGNDSDRWMEGRFLERRKTATLNLINRAAEEFPGLKLFSIEESIADFEVHNFFTFDWFNLDSSITVAAALWMLDDLRKTGRLHEAYQYLPPDREALETVYLPIDFYHPCYEQELIQSVASVLGEMLRNAPEEPAEAYRGLVALLSPEKVERAIGNFRIGQKDILTRYLKIAEYYDKKNEQLLAQIQNAQKPNILMMKPDEKEWKRLAEQGGELEEKHQKQRFYFDLEIGKNRREIIREYGSRDIADVLTKDLFYPDPYETAFAGLYLLGNADEQIMNLRSSCLHIFYAMKRLPWYTKGAYGESEEEDHEEDWLGRGFNDTGWLGREGTEPVDYHRPDPEGKTIAQRIYDLSKGIVPAGFHPFRQEREEMKAQGVEAADLIADQAEMMFLAAYQATAGNIRGRHWWENDDEDSLYPQDAAEEDADDEDSEERDGDRDDESIEEAGEPVRIGGWWGRMAREQGIETERDADSPAGTVSAEARKVPEAETRKMPEAETRKVPEAEAPQASSADTLELLDRARKEIKNLKKALSEISREAEKREVRYEHELKTLRMEHRELADLRSLVFNQNAEDQWRIEKPERQIDYPYSARKRTVIFGGHDSFLRAIKPLLPNVKYVDTDNYSFAPEIVRNADVVWVQTNCISHSQFNNITRVARQHGIQMRYFACSSAEKCAE